MTRPFQSDLVLRQQLSESTLRAYHVGFEQNRFRLIPLVDLLCRIIPEYALGPHAGQNFPLPVSWDHIREAARLVYTTDNYQKRGEIGEIVLHLLLRDFCKSIPLISKVYFKDSPNVTVHVLDPSKDGAGQKHWEFHRLAHPTSRPRAPFISLEVTRI